MIESGIKNWRSTRANWIHSFNQYIKPRQSHFDYCWSGGNLKWYCVLFEQINLSTTIDNIKQNKMYNLILIF